MLGRSLCKLAEASEGIASLRRAVKLDASTGSYGVALAGAQYAAGQREAAYETLSAYSPSSLEEKFRGRYASILAASARAGTEPAVALERLEGAVKALPKEAPLWIALGKERSAAGHPETAFAAYSKALKIEDRDSDVSTVRSAITLAQIAAQASGGSQALDWYRQGAEVAERFAIGENVAEFALLAGRLYRQSEDYLAARNMLGSVAQTAPESVEAAYLLARCSTESKDYDRALGEAAAAVKKAKAVGDTDFLTKSLRHQGFLFEVKGKYREAGESYRQAGDQAKAAKMAKLEEIAAGNDQIDRMRKECRAKKAEVDREWQEMQKKKDLFGAADWQEIELSFQKRLAECQEYL